MTRKKASVLIIYTGGTIGMKQDLDDLTLKPFDFSQILDEVPELGKFAFKLFDLIRRVHLPEDPMPFIIQNKDRDLG